MNTLSAGLVYTLVTDVAYALPPRVVVVFSVLNGGTLQVSNDNSNWQAVTLDSNKNATVAAAYIRSHTADSIVIVKYN